MMVAVVVFYFVERNAICSHRRALRFSLPDVDNMLRGRSNRPRLYSRQHQAN